MTLLNKNVFKKKVLCEFGVWPMEYPHKHGNPMCACVWVCTDIPYVIGT